MALAATIFRADADISDVDRAYYGQHVLTLARHPSETDERMMVRLLAFLNHADERLKFTRGLSETSEPDLWQMDLTGRISLWIETGLPEARRIIQASSRAARVVVYAYGRNAPRWWEQQEEALKRIRNLSVYLLPVDLTRELEGLAARSMQIQCTIQEGQLYLSVGERTLHADLQACLVRDAEK